MLEELYEMGRIVHKKYGPIDWKELIKLYGRLALNDRENARMVLRKIFVDRIYDPACAGAKTIDDVQLLYDALLMYVQLAERDSVREAVKNVYRLENILIGRLQKIRQPNYPYMGSNVMESAEFSRRIADMQDNFRKKVNAIVQVEQQAAE
jgi:hypothetical protein